MRALVLTTALAAALVTAPAAMAQNAQFDRSVAQALQIYNISADVSQLSTHQKAQIYMIANGGKESDRAARIRAVLRPGLLTRLFR